MHKKKQKPETVKKIALDNERYNPESSKNLNSNAKFSKILKKKKKFIEQWNG